MQEPRLSVRLFDVSAAAAGLAGELRQALDISLKQPMPSQMVDALLQLHQRSRHGLRAVPGDAGGPAAGLDTGG
jgi:hypothetical protein